MMEQLKESERRESDTMKVRGRLRGVWLALWLAGAAGSVLVGVNGDNAWWLPLFLFVAAVLVVLAVRSFGRGLDTDGNGVVVRNMLRARPIPWRELAAIEFKGVSSEALENMYYNLVFQRHDGSRVTAEAPGGGARPGEYLFELRERLFAMRSAALGYPQAPRTSHRMPLARTQRLPSRASQTSQQGTGQLIPANIRKTQESQRRTGQPIPAKTRATRERSPGRLRRGGGSSVGAVLLPARRWRWRSPSLPSPTSAHC
jgi:hypothetical protein